MHQPSFYEHRLVRDTYSCVSVGSGAVGETEGRSSEQHAWVRGECSGLGLELLPALSVLERGPLVQAVQRS